MPPWRRVSPQVDLPSIARTGKWRFLRHSVKHQFVFWALSAWELGWPSESCRHSVSGRDDWDDEVGRGRYICFRSFLLGCHFVFLSINRFSHGTMYGSSLALAAGLSGLAAALPPPPAYTGQFGYTGASAPYKTVSPSYSVDEVLATKFGPDSTIAAIHTLAPTIGNTLRSDNETGPTSHGPYSGTPTTVGAVTTATSALSIAPKPLNPTATCPIYPSFRTRSHANVFDRLQHQWQAHSGGADPIRASGRTWN